MLMDNLQTVYEKSRVIFVIDGCPVCRVWKRFIERENLNLKTGKRIMVIDATLLADHGVCNNLFLRVFDRYIQDPIDSGMYSFPVLFIDGKVIRGGNTTEEALNYLRGLLHDDYIQPYDKYEFIQECGYKKINGRKALFCANTIEDEY